MIDYYFVSATATATATTTTTTCNYKVTEKQQKLTTTNNKHEK
jgi:hypothetical protein